MLLIYGNEEVFGAIPPEDFAQVIRHVDALNQKYAEGGELLGAYGVDDQANAKTVRVTNGVPAVTDGPYIEAKEYIGSFYIVDCENLDRALEIAASYAGCPLDDGREVAMPVEVRPLTHESAVDA
jgi:hypothetical protein